MHVANAREWDSHSQRFFTTMKFLKSKKTKKILACSPDATSTAPTNGVPSDLTIILVTFLVTGASATYPRGRTTRVRGPPERPWVLKCF